MAYPDKDIIISAVQNPVFIKDNFFIGGSTMPGRYGSPLHWTGGYSIVFPIIKEGEKWAFKVWFAEIKGIRERYKKISNHIRTYGLRYFVEFAYVENGLLADGHLLDSQRMKWIEGVTLNDYLNDNVTDRIKVLAVAEKFKEMVLFFHQKGIAHGDLQHENIFVTKEGNLLVVDYDSMYISELDETPDVIKGKKGYQHPARDNNSHAHSKLDYFSELVIYLSLLTYCDDSSLWSSHHDRMLFSIEDFLFPYSSEIIKKLLLSPNYIIADLTQKLVDCLRCNDIKHLKPLEQMLINNLDDEAGGIINKF